MLIIGYPKCSTCRKAVKWLRERRQEFEDRNIAEQNPTVEELQRWQKMSGLPLKKFFNTSGRIYKELRLKEKLPGMTEKEQMELLASDGMLVKRPLLILEDYVLVGFCEEQWAEKVK